MKSLRFKRNLSQLNIVELANNLGMKKYSQAKKFLGNNRKLDDGQKEFIEREYKLIQSRTNKAICHARIATGL